jgi:hypothetical protein
MRAILGQLYWLRKFFPIYDATEKMLPKCFWKGVLEKEFWTNTDHIQGENLFFCHFKDTFICIVKL